MNDEVAYTKKNIYRRIAFILIAFFLSACVPSPALTLTPTNVPFILPKTPTPASSRCTSIEIAPTSAASGDSLFPPISDADMTRGFADAAVTLIVYSDFQDAPSAFFDSVLARLAEKYPKELRIVDRDFPLMTNPGHEKAGLAAQAAQAASLQGKYREMHDLLFAEQETWSPLSEKEFILWLTENASGIGLDAAQLSKDMQSIEIVEKVEQAFQWGIEKGLPGTPFLLLNGQIYTGRFDFESLDQIISLIALGERQFTTCPPIVLDFEKEYLAILETEKGDIVIQLYSKQAPMAINNFIFLAKEGWYDNITFHRVLPDYFAETGDPSGTGRGHPGYFFADEIDSALLFDRPGVVAMRNMGADINGSQFFITYDSMPTYDGKYTIFGQVISGMDVLNELSPRDSKLGETLPAGDSLLSVTIKER